MAHDQGPAVMAARACQLVHRAGRVGQSSPDQMGQVQLLLYAATWRFGLVRLVRQYGWRRCKAAYGRHLSQQHQPACQAPTLPPRNHCRPACAPRVIFPIRQSPALHRHGSARHRANGLLPAVRVRGLQLWHLLKIAGETLYPAESNRRTARLGRYLSPD